MRYESLPQSFYKENRERFKKQMKPRSVAIFHSNDEMPKNADGTFPFRQNNDLFYLTGIDQEESILLISPDFPDPKYKEVLFLRETNEKIAVWEGQKLTKEDAIRISGVEKVYWLSELPAALRWVCCQSENIYLNSNEHFRAFPLVETREARFIRELQNSYPLHNYERCAPIMHRLRSLKQKSEVDRIRYACSVTEKGFRRILPFIKPGVMEFEIEAELTHEFIRHRCAHAYAPIIASGTSACVLHYVDNNKPCKNGDVLLLDFGAEYGNYASDLTRCIPVSGTFTPRQRQVYNAVLKVMKMATAMLVPGNLLEDYHKEVGKIMEKELIALGLLKKDEVEKQNEDEPLYKKYFMHGTSHFLGLDVHDVGNRYLKFEENMIFTCEPGIYIKEENLGIRLENDILITKNGPVNLMENIPVEAEEIEEMMRNG